jgi:hypothetical protein
MLCLAFLAGPALDDGGPRAAAAAAVPPVPLPAGWSFRLLPVPEGSRSWAFGINDRGEVVGMSDRRVDGVNRLAPTLWRPGQGPAYYPLPPGFRHGAAYRITDQGSVLGDCWNDPNGPLTGVIWPRRPDSAAAGPSFGSLAVQDEPVEPVPLPAGWIPTDLWDLADRRIEVVGGTELPNDAGFAAFCLTILSNRIAATLTLPTLGGLNAFVTSVNAFGVKAGWAKTADGKRKPVLWVFNAATGRFDVIELPLPPGDDQGFVNDVNELQEAAGGTQRASGEMVSIIWYGPGGTPLKSPANFPRGEATRINNLGWGVGKAFDAAGVNLRPLLLGGDNLLFDLTGHPPFANAPPVEVNDTNNAGEVATNVLDEFGRIRGGVYAPVGPVADFTSGLQRLSSLIDRLIRDPDFTNENPAEVDITAREFFIVGLDHARERLLTDQEAGRNLLRSQLRYGGEVIDADARDILVELQEIIRLLER